MTTTRKKVGSPEDPHAQLLEERESYAKEVSDFNLGWDCADSGGSLEDRPDGCGDSWEDGFRSCRYDSLLSEVEGLSESISEVSGREVVSAERADTLKLEVQGLESRNLALSQQIESLSEDLSKVTGLFEDSKADYQRLLHEYQEAVSECFHKGQELEESSRSIRLLEQDIEGSRVVSERSLRHMDHYVSMIRYLVGKGKGPDEFSVMIGEKYAVAAALWKAFGGS